MATPMRKRVQELMAEKVAIEKEMRALYDVLESQGNVGMNEPLVDSEGYPRSDIDVYSVRTARHRIICLQNDHKSVMSKVEASLHEVHAFERQQRDFGIETSSNGASNAAVALIPFARVDYVSEGSPAEQAGLSAGDDIVDLDCVNTTNFKTMQDIASLVQHNQGKSLRVVVLRQSREVVLSLKPHPWSGRGLLGCNIVPFQK